MEIEAKFAVPNRDVFRSLARAGELAGFRVRSAGTVRMLDRYFDTADGRLQRQGYTCRLRQSGQEQLVTLKGLGGALGAIHRREEIEAPISEWSPNPAEWDAEQVREAAMGLVGSEKLEPLFELRQERTRADLLDGQRVVGQLSLDAVRVAVGDRPGLYYELEAELAPTGKESDLLRLSNALESEWGLRPEPRSKFERALDTLRRRGSAVEDRLTLDERAALEAVAGGGDADLARRAGVVLAWAEGCPTREIIRRTGFSDGRVRHWLRAFRIDRMAIFSVSSRSLPERTVPSASGAVAPPRPGPLPQTFAAKEPAKVLTNPDLAPVVPATSTDNQDPMQQHEIQAEKTRRKAKGMAKRGGSRKGTHSSNVTTANEASPKVSPKSPPDAKGRNPREAIGLSAFCRLHKVQMAHARHVADLAVTLFSPLRAVHRLPRKRQDLLRAAALLTTVGASVDPDRPAQAGRDLILSQPLKKVTDADRQLLACAVALTGKKVRPGREPALLSLAAKWRPQALALAAILRIAESLDASRTQTTQIGSVEFVNGDTIRISLSGPFAAAEARSAAEAARLWRRLYLGEVTFAIPNGELFSADMDETPEASAQEDCQKAPKTVSLTDVQIVPMRPDQPMSEAGRNVLLRHYRKMLDNEAGTRSGEDIEALHDMRVATRRMRAAFLLFEPYYRRNAVRPLGRMLRATGRALGTVRDLDVLLDKAKRFGEALPEEAAWSFEPLLAHWMERRDLARSRMLAHLDSAEYREFVAAFADFLATPGRAALSPSLSEPAPFQVRHVAPGLILARYETVRSYEVALPGGPLTTHHLLRIDCKRLRYALEFFNEPLGPAAAPLIRQVTNMQDLLGELQDAHVAAGLLSEFVSQQGGSSLPAVDLYMARQREVETSLLASFAEPWQALVSPEFRQSLFQVLAGI